MKRRRSRGGEVSSWGAGSQKRRLQRCHFFLWFPKTAFFCLLQYHQSRLPTYQVLALCEEDDVTLHGLVLAAGLTAVARFLSLDPFLCFLLRQISIIHRLWHGKTSIFGLFSLFPVASDFYCPSTGCAMAAVPPQRQQRHCELRSRQTFVNIAVRHRGTGCTQRHMMRRTASHLLSTQKISGV